MTDAGPDQTDAPDQIETLTDRAELLWRNVHPNWVETDGTISSQAFRPTIKDAGRLSTARSNKVSAADHYAEHTGRRLASDGVWAVSVSEAADLGLPCRYDEHSSTVPQPAPTGHTSIDFTALSGAAARKAGGVLRDRAEARGRQHP